MRLVVAMADLHKFARGRRGRNLTLIHLKKVLGDLLQHLQFVVVDNGPLVLLEPVEEDPACSPLGGRDGPRSTTLAHSWQSNPLLEQSPPKSASMRPWGISVVACRKAISVTPACRIQRVKVRVRQMNIAFSYYRVQW